MNRFLWVSIIQIVETGFLYWFYPERGTNKNTYFVINTIYFKCLISGCRQCIIRNKKQLLPMTYTINVNKQTSTITLKTLGVHWLYHNPKDMSWQVPSSHSNAQRLKVWIPKHLSLQIQLIQQKCCWEYFWFTIFNGHKIQGKLSSPQAPLKLMALNCLLKYG